MMKAVVVALILFGVSQGFGVGKEIRTIDLKVAGMRCENCTEKVKSALKKVKDVQDVEVSLKSNTAMVGVGSESATTPEMLAQAVAEAGFSASYTDGDETKTVAATKEHDECDDECDDASKEKSAKDGGSGCCMGKAAKAKATKVAK